MLYIDLYRYFETYAPNLGLELFEDHSHDCHGLDSDEASEPVDLVEPGAGVAGTGVGEAEVGQDNIDHQKEEVSYNI